MQIASGRRDFNSRKKRDGGYYTNPEETAKVMTKTAFTHGRVAYIDERHFCITTAKRLFKYRPAILAPRRSKVSETIAARLAGGRAVGQKTSRRARRA